MPNIQVSLANGKVVGTGTGVINASQQTATIQTWDKPSALVVGNSYKLKSEGKTYDAVCTASHPSVAPVATFDKVE